MPTSNKSRPVTEIFYDDDDYCDDEDSPYCECDLEPIEEEEASGVCFCCGKPLC